jgi:hypothetical protein
VRLPEPSATVAAAGLRSARISREGAVLAFGDAYRVTLVTAIVALGLCYLLPASSLPRSAELGAHPSTVAMNRVPSPHRHQIFLLAALAVLMASIDLTVVAVALWINVPIWRRPLRGRPGWDGWDVLAPRLSFGKVLELLRYRKSA